MSSTGLYEPSLSPDNIRPTRSYNLGSLFYIAFFGGTLALGILGIHNGRKLHVRPSVLYVLIVLTVLVFAGKMIFYYAFFHGQIQVERQAAKYMARVGDILLFGVYYLAMKQPFRQHQLLGGDTDPLWKMGIVWCVISFIVEMVCLTLVSGGE